MLESIRHEVTNLLGTDTSGHSVDHVERVYTLSMKLAEQEGADKEIVGLTALLHDVDDYKLFGQESAESLANATRILRQHKVSAELSGRVLASISTMGYSKYLESIRPTTLEGKVVSDADMCDAIGSQGLIRVFEYNASKGRPFFNPALPPIRAENSADAYRASANEHAVQHFFDKLLKIPAILMTDSGKVEGAQRAEVMELFLKELFREYGAEQWRDFMDTYATIK
ncbi:TPA: hypothetical protein DD425_02105 [Candidatus Saccharibacteria bacterium]|nr:hypothetical protein [Candidatus Saccharibacteria bacterium]|tara:strand:+ start:2014 stop:2694 length:681 start_codon:yes stop_codon:yes gene_type:complete